VPRRAVLLTLIALSLVAPHPARAADDAKSYDVRLARTSKVGDRAKVDVMGAVRKQVSSRTEGAEPRTSDESYGVRFDGTAEVKAVAPNGQRTKVTYTVTSCAIMAGQKTRDLFPAGTTIVASWQKDRTTFTANDKAATEPEAELLSLVLDLDDPEGANDDAVFHTAGKKKVGDTWAIDAAAAAKELKRIGMEAKEEDCWGEATLKEVAPVDGKPCLKVETNLKVRTMAGPGRRADAKFKLDGGTFAVHGIVTLPLDSAAPVKHDEAKVTVVAQMSGTEDGKKVQVSRASERVVDRTVTPLSE
jgi:hypothetical protein